MQIQLIALGQKLPDWIRAACDEYLKRFPSTVTITCLEISTRKGITNPTLIKQIQAKLKQDYTIALSAEGKELNSHQFAQKLSEWLHTYSLINFVIGDAYGIPKEIVQQSHFQWSLSKLTYPHQWVRLLVIEQLYRAHSIYTGHPYHK